MVCLCFSYNFILFVEVHDTTGQTLGGILRQLRGRPKSNSYTIREVLFAKFEKVDKKSQNFRNGEMFRSWYTLPANFFGVIGHFT